LRTTGKKIIGAEVSEKFAAFLRACVAAEQVGLWPRELSVDLEIQPIPASVGL